MDSVLDFLFLRRLRFEYVCPPICPITPASASGLAVTGQVISPILAMPAPRSSGNFLLWNCASGQVCYNVYFQTSENSFVESAQCIPPNSFVVCSPGCWEVFPVRGGVQGEPVGPYCIDGSQPVILALPDDSTIESYNVYKDGELRLAGTFCNGFESCVAGCYSVSAVTGDGETPPSETTCVLGPPLPPPVGSAFPYDTFETYSNGDALAGLTGGENGNEPVATWNPTNPYVVNSTGVSLLAWDTFEGYNNGDNLAGLSGGVGAWASVYTVS